MAKKAIDVISLWDGYSYNREMGREREREEGERRRREGGGREEVSDWFSFRKIFSRRKAATKFLVKQSFGQLLIRIWIRIRDSNPDSNTDSNSDPKLTPTWIRIRNRIRNFCFGAVTLH